ncbi:DNA repair protein RecO [Rickettsiales bacterium]|jgi:DNA repair protein RecO (recombination protein O)|nr:DNA repair protein RecO [Rickettsiales bacterium]|tara:strand:+ start:6365 stop:7093 length:729 start_codon:yes stop_codon:yes gene_type:complete
MRFFDEGIIINISNYQDSSAIIKLLTKDHGICCGFIKNAKSKKAISLYQIGNLITFEYRNRIDDNLGSFFNVDISKSYLAPLIFEPFKLELVKLPLYIFDKAFLEREEHRLLFLELISFFEEIASDNITNYHAVGKYIKFELKILESLGYGIDITCCVVTNNSDNLAFISPKSAKAVSYEIGKPYEKKLLILPNFLTGHLDNNIAKNDLINGLKLTGYFLAKNIFYDNKIFNNLRDNFLLRI